MDPARHPHLPFLIQYVCIGVAILQDAGAEPVFPRWVAYYNWAITAEQRREA